MKIAEQIIERCGEGPCYAACDWLESLPEGTTPEQAWVLCPRADWLLWFVQHTNPDIHSWTCVDLARLFAADALDAAGVTHELRDCAPVVDSKTARTAARAAARAAAAAAADAEAAARAADAAAAAAWAAAAAAADADAEAAAREGAAAAADAAAVVSMPHHAEMVRERISFKSLEVTP